MPRTRVVAELEAEIEQLSHDKARYLATSRSEARKVQAKLNTIIGKEKAKAKLDAMSPEEKAAMADALGVN